MTEENDNPADAGEPAPDETASLAQARLRHRAEEEASKADLPGIDTSSPEEVRRMLHELRVHQIELTMQNEELRRAQEELDASRERYIDLYDLAPVGYCTVSREGLIIEANLTLADLLGTTRGDLVNRIFSGFVSKEDQDYYYYYYRKLFFESDEPQDVELRMKRAVGEPVWVRIEGRRSGDEETGYACRTAISDITVRKKAEEELEKYRAGLEELVKARTVELESANTSLAAEITERRKALEALRNERDICQVVMDGAKNSHLVYLDRDFNFVRVNEAYAATCGYRPEEMIGKNHFDLYPHEENEAIFAGVRDTGEAYEVHDKPFEFPDQPGRGVTYWDWTLTPVKDRAGEVRGLVFSLFETTERKRAEEALRDARDELELRVEERTLELRRKEELAQEQKHEIDTYYEASPIGLCVLDRDLRYLRINKRLADINGLAASEHMGRTIRDVLRPALADRIEPLLCGVIETGEPVKDMEYTGEHPHRSGVRGTWLGTFNPLKDTTGRVVGIAVAVQDITELRRLEHELRQAHKMEALGTMTGGIAHDFNNILAAIMGFTEMSLDDTEEGSRIEKNLKNVLTSAFRARNLIKQMLAFTRKTATERNSLSLTPLIKETAKLLRASIPTSVHIELNASATSDMVLANATDIQQIVMNLSVNAAYAMREEGGKLTITLEDAEGTPAGLAPGDYVTLSVRDTGTGIEASLLDKIFDPFFTTKEVGEGTGMGLAVVYGIVRSLNGAVTVESAPGRGSVFTIFLPKTSTKDIKHVESHKEMPHGKERVLFIDDEEMLSELGQAILARLGYGVTTFTDSRAALKRFLEEPLAFDLVITDQTMPELTGLRLAEEVLKVRPDMPVLLCTGYNDRVDPEKVKAAGIKEFLMKPLSKQELAEAVRRALDHSSTERNGQPL